MFHLFQFGNHRPPQFGKGLLIHGIIFTFFGLAILAAPELLAMFVATILLIIGISCLSSWWKTRR